MIRRFTLAFAIVRCANKSWSQIMLVLYLSIAIIIFKGWFRPFQDRWDNTMEIVNETLVLANCYFMVLYSEFVPDVHVRYKLGWINIALIGIMILINVVMIGGKNVYAAYRKYKIARMKRTHRLRIAEAAARKAFTATLVDALKKDDNIIYEESSESSNLSSVAREPEPS